MTARLPVPAFAVPFEFRSNTIKPSSLARAAPHEPRGPLSEATKQNISDALLQHYQDQPMTEEHKQNISDALLQHHQDHPETGRKFSDAQQQRNMPSKALRHTCVNCGTQSGYTWYRPVGAQGQVVKDTQVRLCGACSRKNKKGDLLC